jgi:hypothetical protein
MRARFSIVMRQTKQKQTKLPKGTLLSAIKEETYTPLRYALCCAWQFSFSTHAALFCLNAIPASSIRYNLVIGGVLFVDSFRFFDVTVRGERIAWLESRLRREFFIIIFSKRERERERSGGGLPSGTGQTNVCIQHPSPLSKLHRSCRLCPRCCVQYERENSLPAWHSVHRSKRETVNDLLCTVLTSTWRRRKNPP